MIAWIVLILSVLGLVAVFLNRMLKTKRDRVFQQSLEEELAEEAMEMVEEALEDEVASLSAQEVKKKLGRAEVAVKRGDFDAASALLEEILEADDGHLEANLQIGRMNMKREDFAGAELYFSKLVNLKKDPVFFSNLGAALYNQQRLLEAAEAYENAVALDDKRAARFESLAQVYHELGDIENALKHFEVASRKKPKDMNLKFVLAEYYERLERFDEALSLLEKILEADPYNKDVKAKHKAIRSLL